MGGSVAARGGGSGDAARSGGRRGDPVRRPGRHRADPLGPLPAQGPSPHPARARRAQSAAASRSGGGAEERTGDLVRRTGGRQSPRTRPEGRWPRGGEGAGLGLPGGGRGEGGVGAAAGAAPSLGPATHAALQRYLPVFLLASSGGKPCPALILAGLQRCCEEN